MTKLNTLSAIQAELTAPGAMLMKDTRVSIDAYYVLHADGRRVRCNAVADRLTYASRKDGVKFSHRTPLELFYVPR